MTLDTWCPGIDRPPHVPDQPPTITIDVGHGPVVLCRSCWHAWRTNDRPTDD